MFGRLAAELARSLRSWQAEEPKKGRKEAAGLGVWLVSGGRGVGGLGGLGPGSLCGCGWVWVWVGVGEGEGG